MRTLKDQHTVLIIGGRGEFGQFLQRDILPALGVDSVALVERGTPVETRVALIDSARHIVLATPLAGYAERACELAFECRHLHRKTTIWLLPSVQAGVWRAIRTAPSMIDNPFLSVIMAHPMYGPNGFRVAEPEAKTFQNILTGYHQGADHPLSEEIDRICDLFWTTFHIRTIRSFDPEEHDRITAYSQGLSYCIAHLMFERTDLDAQVEVEMPELHRSFHTNRGLILAFLRINTYMSRVMATFTSAWRQTGQLTFEDLLRAFVEADQALNQGQDSPIPTKWYEKLRGAGRRL